MPGYKTKSSGKWAKIHTEKTLWCMLCNKSVAIDHGGLSQVNQHLKTNDHKVKADARFSTTQPKFQKVGNSMEYLNKSIDKRVLEAECLWAFKLAEEDWSFASIDDVKILFKRMFGGEVLEHFSAGHTKMSYIVRHGLSDVLLSGQVEDLNKCVGTFTLLLDETQQQLNLRNSAIFS